MTKRSFKVIFALAVAALFFVLIALSVSAEGEQITIKYYQNDGSKGSAYYWGGSSYEDGYNPDQNLKLTETYTAGDTVTVRADKYSKDESGRTFYGWFSEDGTLYEAGQSYVFTKDTRLYEAYGTEVSTLADLKTYIGKRWYVKLGADIETTSKIGIPEGMCVLDMNGHNLTATIADSLFTGSRAGIMITGNGTITYTSTRTGNNLAADAVYKPERHHYNDNIAQRLWVGKGVTIVTNANLIYVQNSLDEDNTACCPRVKIYGNVTAERLINTASALRRCYVEIFDGSNITLNSTEVFKSSYSSTSKQFDIYIYGGNFTLQENSVFYDVIDKFGYNITGGTFNYALPSGLLKNGYENVLNETSGKYEVRFVGCTVYADGNHVFEPTTPIDGRVVTCTENGYYTYECACGKTYDDIYPALGHDYDDPVVDKDYTLTEHGLTSWHCKRCDHVVTRATYPQIDEIYFTVTLEIDSAVKTIRVKATDFITYSKQSDTTVTTDYVLLMKEIKSTFKDADDESATYSRDNITGIKIPLGITQVENNNNGIRKIGSKLKTIDFSATYGLTVNSYSFENSTVLTDIIFGDNMTILGSAFKNCDALTKIVVGDGLKVNFAGEWVFSECDGILSAEFGASDITFGRNSFRKTGTDGQYTPLNSVKFSDGGKYTFDSRAFGYCSMTEVVFPDGAEVLTVADNTDSFWRCNYIKYVYLGEGTKSAAKLFDDCAGLQKVVLVGPTYIGDSGFCVGTATGEDVGVLKVYIHQSSCDIKNNAFQRRSGIQVYTMAPITNGNAFKDCAATTKTVNGESVSYPKYTIYYGIAHEYTAHTFAPTCTTEGYDGYITDCPHCQANAEPDYENPVTYSVYEAKTTNNTATSTVTLEKTKIVETIAHTAGDIVRITYANGFDNAGVHIRICTVCGNNYDAEDANAIFAASGYSLGTDTMYAGFTVNTDALSAYNLYAGEGKELKYGIIVSNVNDSSITSVNFDDNKVITNENSIQIEITNYGFSRFGLTLTGFTDATKALNIVMSAYVIDGDGNMSFVQSGTATDTTYVKTIDAIVGETTKATLGAVTFTKISELQA